MTNRKNFNEYYLEMAELVATRSTCSRRSVGAVITDVDNFVLSTGYNGAPSGQPHCINELCPGAKSPSGRDLDLCQALHAEQNAVARLSNFKDAHNIYCTTAPCISCAKLISATRIRNVYFRSDYPKSGKALWESLGEGFTWTQIK